MWLYMRESLYEQEQVEWLHVRLRVIAVSLALLIMLPAILPSVSADFSITLDMNEVSLIPTMMGNSTEYPNQDIKSLSLAYDGTMFTVCHNTNWEIIRGETPVSERG